ncbi:MAG: hypothetical protein K0R00_1656 [Herbinix sp.]|nr:hypothetical protein [Herbinix sp.]
MYNGYNSYVPYGYALNNNPYYPIMAMATPTQQVQEVDRFIYPQNLPSALSLIQQALAGETEDRMFYSWLIEHNATPTS